MPVRYSDQSAGPDTRRALDRLPVEETSYEDWTKDELQAELEARGLPKTSNKPELIASLVADDNE